MQYQYLLLRLLNVHLLGILSKNKCVNNGQLRVRAFGKRVRIYSSTRQKNDKQNVIMYPKTLRQ